METPTPVLLAFHGLRGVGKDTTIQFVSDWAAESDPAPSVVRRGFADKMKLAFARQFFPGINQREAIIWCDKYKNSDRIFRVPGFDNGMYSHDLTFRDCMDQFATESAREVYGDDHWVDMLLPPGYDKIWTSWPNWWFSFASKLDENTMGVPEYCCINDLRADNEVARVKEIPNSLCIKIKRKDREAEVRAQYEGTPHLFARELPDELFDIIIVNNDNNMDQARRRTRSMMNVIRSDGPESIKRGSPLPWRIT